MIKVLVFGLPLRTAVGGHEIDVESVEPTTVKILLETHQDQLGAVLPFMMNQDVLVVVNKRIATADSPVKDGDVVKLSYHTINLSYDGTRDIPT